MSVRVLVRGIVVVLTMLSVGCGQAPQISPQHRKLLAAVQTAVSAKNTDWLDAVESDLKTRHEQDQIADSEFDAIQSIVDLAKSGDWTKAQQNSFKLSEGQRPSADDLAALKDRQRTKEPKTQ